jgi:hypothetical protein
MVVMMVVVVVVMVMIGPVMRHRAHRLAAGSRADCVDAQMLVAACCSAGRAANGTGRPVVAALREHSRGGEYECRSYNHRFENHSMPPCLLGHGQVAGVRNGSVSAEIAV